MTEKWTDTPRDQYGCKELPNIRLSLMDNDKIVYTMLLDTLVEHEMWVDSEYKNLEFSTALMNDKDYAALVSKKYDKYIVETQQYWRSGSDGKDYLIELPAQVFSSFMIKYKTSVEGDPARWKFVFEERSEEEE